MKPEDAVYVGIGPEGLLRVLGLQQCALVRLGAAQYEAIILELGAADRTAEVIWPGRRGYRRFVRAAARVWQSASKSPVIRPAGAGIWISEVDHSAFPSMSIGP